ncbi:hypothetical protein JTB14_025543 [Gonioctena quinquepunctata]|nr:hypothetical protein JTB14_025543 [Gonioctena quinquepunctata]
MMDDPESLNIQLCRILMQHREIPNSTTGKSPTELMFERQFRTIIDFVERNVDSETNDSWNLGQKQYFSESVIWFKHVLMTETLNGVSQKSLPK